MSYNLVRVEVKRKYDIWVVFNSERITWQTVFNMKKRYINTLLVVTLSYLFRKQYGNIYQTIELFQLSILAIFEISQQILQAY